MFNNINNDWTTVPVRGGTPKTDDNVNSEGCLKLAKETERDYLGKQVDIAPDTCVINSSNSIPCQSIKSGNGRVDDKVICKEYLNLPRYKEDSSVLTCKNCGLLYNHACQCWYKQCLCGNWSSKMACRICSVRFTGGTLTPSQRKQLKKAYTNRLHIFQRNHKLNKPKGNTSGVTFSLGSENVRDRIITRGNLKYGPNNWYCMYGSKIIDLDSFVPSHMEHSLLYYPRLRGGMLNDKVDEPIKIEENDDLVFIDLDGDKYIDLEKQYEIGEEKLLDMQKKKRDKVKHDKWNLKNSQRSDKIKKLIGQSTNTYAPSPNLIQPKVVVNRNNTNPTPWTFRGPKNQCPPGANLEPNETEPQYYYDAQILNNNYRQSTQKVTFDNYLETPMIQCYASVNDQNILTPPRVADRIQVWYPDHEQHSKDHLWTTRDVVTLTIRRGKSILKYNFDGSLVTPTSMVFRTLRLYQLDAFGVHSIQERLDQTLTLEYKHSKYVVPKYLYSFITTLNPSLETHVVRNVLDRVKKHFESSIIDIYDRYFTETIQDISAFWSTQFKQLQHDNITHTLDSIQQEKLSHELLSNPGTTNIWTLLDSVAKTFLPHFMYQYVHGYLNKIIQNGLYKTLTFSFTAFKEMLGYGQKMYAFRFLNETVSIMLEELLKTIPGMSLPVIALDLLELRADGDLNWYTALKAILFHGWTELCPLSLRFITLPFRAILHVWWNKSQNTTTWSEYEIDQLQQENRKSALLECSKQILKIQATIGHIETLEEHMLNVEPDTPARTLEINIKTLNHSGMQKLRQRANFEQNEPIRELKRNVSYLYHAMEGTYYFADNYTNLYTGLLKRCYQPQEPHDQDYFDLFERISDKINVHFQDNRVPHNINKYIAEHPRHASLYAQHYERTKRCTPDELKYRNTARNKSNEKSGKDIDRIYWAAEVPVAARVGAVLEPFQWYLKEILFSGLVDLNSELELGLDHEVYILYSAVPSQIVGDFLFRAKHDPNNFYLAILGDDSLASHLRLMFGSDMSRFDSTIHKRLLLLFRKMIMTDHEDDPLIQVFLKQWDAPCGYQDGKEWIALPKPNGLPTGCAWTGVSNTLNMGISFLVNLLMKKTLHQSPDTHKKLGWIAKPNVYTEDQFPEFLKRIWVPYNNTCYPVPIISMFVKALGSCEQPVGRLVPLGKLRDDFGNESAFNYGVMNSMLNTDHIPYFAPLKQHYYDNTTLLTKDYIQKDDAWEYKMQASDRHLEPLPDELVDEAYLQRYDLERFAIQCLMKNLFFTKDTLYQRYTSPTLRTIMSADYGYEFPTD